LAAGHRKDHGVADHRTDHGVVDHVYHMNRGVVCSHTSRDVVCCADCRSSSLHPEIAGVWEAHSALRDLVDDARVSCALGVEERHFQNQRKNSVWA
jgi:hypothetical protein